MRIAAHTLGCKLNYAETSDLLRRLADDGNVVVDFGEVADMYVINTCTVTAVAEKKCRNAIRQAVAQNPQAKVVVIGCFAQVAADEIGRIPGVTMVLGNDRKHMLPELVRSNFDPATLHTSHSTFHLQYSSGDRTRVFFKIQDGCDYFCTYCAIPFARGRSRSATIEETLCAARRIVSEERRVERGEWRVESGERRVESGEWRVEKGEGRVESGEWRVENELPHSDALHSPFSTRHSLEVVLTGVNTGTFGQQHGEQLIDLLRGLDEIEGIARYRISSIEPNLLTDEMIDFIAQSRAFLPHFHIPLQAGSDHVLKMMHRRYDTELYRRKLLYIKDKMPDACIAADVMAGFNGETEEEFEKVMRYIDSLPISYLHVFTYSDRPGTAALRLGEKIPMHTRREHTGRLLELSDKKHKAFIDSQIGKTRPVLWESSKVESEKLGVESRAATSGTLSALHSPLSTLHSPLSTLMLGWTDNYIRLACPYDETRVGTIEQVIITPDNIVYER